MAKRLLSIQKIVNLASDPATGTAGEIYYNTALNAYKYYNGTTWTTISSDAGVYVGITAPASPSEGDLWYNSETGKLLIYYDNFWVELSGGGGGSSLPDQTGNSGKFLTTNGTEASWAIVDALPSQTGNSGKFLTTNGTSATWSTASPTVTLGGDLTGSATFTNLGNATLNATIAANSVELGTDTTGQYIAAVSGTTNQINVSGSGTESITLTLSTPQDIHSGASPTFAGATLDSVRVGITAANEIDTSSGNLIIDSAGGTVTVDDNLTVSGNLTVNGTTTTVNSTTITVDDPVITLGGDTAPSADDGKDRGIEFRYYDTQARLGFMGYNDSTGEFTLLTNATNTNEVFSGTKATLNAHLSGSNINAGTVSATYIDPAIARLASPTFTGTPAAPTAAVGTNTTQLATTAFVNAEIANDALGKSGLQVVTQAAGASIATAGQVNTLQILQPTAGSDAFITFHVSNDYAAHLGVDGTTNDLSYGGWSAGANKYRVWHAGNDGTGSGLDADLLDGLQGSAYAIVSGKLSQFAATTSAELAGVISDETGTGALVFANSPTLTTPNIGAATGISLNLSSNIQAESGHNDNITTRIKSGFWQTNVATIANGWPETTNTWYHLISSTHNNTGNYYSLQVAAPFYSNKLYFRSTNGNGNTQWAEVATVAYVNANSGGSGPHPFLLAGM